MIRWREVGRTGLCLSLTGNSSIHFFVTACHNQGHRRSGVKPGGYGHKARRNPGWGANASQGTRTPQSHWTCYIFKFNLILRMYIIHLQPNVFEQAVFLPFLVKLQAKCLEERVLQISGTVRSSWKWPASPDLKPQRSPRHAGKVQAHAAVCGLWLCGSERPSVSNEWITERLTAVTLRGSCLAHSLIPGWCWSYFFPNSQSVLFLFWHHSCS